MLPATLLVAGAVLTGCTAPSFGAYRGATSQGHDEFKLWVVMVAAGLIVAVIVWALIFWSVLKYRRKGDEIPRQFHEHIKLEIFYTIVPILIVFGIFWATVLTEDNVDATPANPTVTVNVTGFKWGWQFSYAGKNITIITQTKASLSVLAQTPSSGIYPQLVLPLGETTEISLHSLDVEHSMWVPAFNFSRMAIPGYNTQYFDFTPTQLGVFDGRCNQYCGLYHSEMLFSVRVVTPAEFQAWEAAQQASQSSSSGGAA